MVYSMGESKIMELSIIIPFIGEYPQVMFTIQAVAQQFIDRADFEIVAVDNYIENHPRISISENKSGPAIACTQRGNPWLKYVQYQSDLSHWQAKRYGVKKSTGKYLMFVDAHVMPSRNSLYGMFEYYKNSSRNHEGTFHLPVTYKILEYHRMIYKLLVEHECFYDYRFTPYPNRETKTFEIPCMSTCGMIISRELYDKIGGWPNTLTTYSGGEHFINFTLAVCGFKKWIFPYGTLFHHGAPRDYSYEYDGLAYNRLLSHYLFGGKSLLDRFQKVVKGKPAAIDQLAKKAMKDGFAQRQHIKKSQTMLIEEWRSTWI